MPHPTKKRKKAAAAAAAASPRAKAAAAPNPPPASPSERPAPPAPSWEEMLYRLILYKARNEGSCDVPESHVVTDGDRRYELGAWVHRQRRLYQNRFQRTPSSAPARSVIRSSTAELTDDRVTALTEIGMIWNLQEAAWNAMFAELVAFKAQHGNCDVPMKHGRLGRWVREQRNEFGEIDGTMVSLGPTGRRRGTPGKFSAGAAAGAGGDDVDNPDNGGTTQGKKRRVKWEERRAKLNSIGFIWRKKNRTPWTERLEELRAFRDANGHCRVPQHYSANRPLGKWVTKMRYEYTKLMRGEQSQLTEDRIRILEELGFAWNGFKGGSKRSRDRSEEELTWVPPHPPAAPQP